MKKIFAHRGMSALAPENTLSAFSLCKEHGVQWFECDVDILKDGTLVVCHDDTFDRCSDASGRLCDTTQNALATIDAGSWFSDQYLNERIPTIQQLITLANEKKLNLNIEIKSCIGGAKLAHQLIANLTIAIKALDPERELIVSSFNFLLLAEFKRLNPDISVACLFETHNIHDDWQSLAEWCQAEYIHPENKGLSRERVKQFIEAGYRVNVWTVNNLARANELFNWGVEGVCTDVGHLYPSKYKINS
ncbi:glycerophosphoryl diester phosphodiesterase [Vibrio sp. SS-MA-C1-2]|uniref:glycerophosphoryl diester phosphodiesterase n=1 Tax=Vibrio sp. SS-MA-C1-2 TaxID=2908646 RepID=UPI001F45E2EA|nr:glycerophosphoryl diester phosphodiesterase [Vibrio sp. SS-MA-C1-2]UJF20133.1 glycerophosphoryl diester phosphodiesterase [Vibrio sp. SS-MA-C1-2]